MTGDKMDILYLLKVLKTKKLSELAAAIDAPPLDMNLAIWDAIAAGDIEVDESKDSVKMLKDSVTPWHDPDLASKLIRAIQKYASEEVNITRGRLQSYIKDPMTSQGYPLHEYLMTIQYLIDTGVVIEHVVSVPEVKKKRPFHKFVFLCLPENEAMNEEWNAKAVNKWIAGFESNKVK
jgi:hypothetical protein